MTRYALAIAFASGVLTSYAVRPAAPDRPTVKRIFREARVTRGNTNILRCSRLTTRRGCGFPGTAA